MNNFVQAMNLIAENCNIAMQDKEKFIAKASKKMQDELSGYNANFEEIFANKVANNCYNSPIEIQNINFYSHCKHHFSPIIGKIAVSYTPNKWIIGFSRIIQCVNAFTKRLQLQEELTVQIAQEIFTKLEAKSVTVTIVAQHYCMQHTPNEALPEIKTVHTI